ncbi:hypothetical protein GAMM_40110 [Gammaproteobacteria bacterium]
MYIRGFLQLDCESKLRGLRIPMKSINHSDSNRSMIPVQTDQ